MYALPFCLLAFFARSLIFYSGRVAVPRAFPLFRLILSSEPVACQRRRASPSSRVDSRPVTGTLKKGYRSRSATVPSFREWPRKRSEHSHHRLVALRARRRDGLGVCVDHWLEQHRSVCRIHPRPRNSRSISIRSSTPRQELGLNPLHSLDSENRTTRLRNGGDHCGVRPRVVRWIRYV